MRAVDLGVPIGAEHAEPLVGCFAEEVAEKSHVDGVAQCRSSRISRTTRSSAARAKRSVTAANSRRLLERGLGPDRLGGVDGRDQASDLAAVGGHVGRHHRGVQLWHPCSQRLGEGLVRHGQVLFAATEEHQRALLVGLAGERRHEAGLADARFTSDEHRSSLARARRLERGAQPVELGAPADHPFRRGRRQRNRQRRSCASASSNLIL